MYITLSGIAFLLTAAGLRVNPALLVAGNFAIGLTFGWVVAAQTTFIHVIPVERMAHVTSTMIGSLIVLEGVGAVAFGAVAGTFGVPAAYLLAGAIVTATGLTAIGYGRSHAQALDISRPKLAAPKPEGSGRLSKDLTAGIRTRTWGHNS
jgi:hypothetical protein